MQKILFYFVLGVLILFYSCVSKDSKSHVNDNLILIKGGSFVNKKSNLYGKNVVVNDFYIGKSEVTQKEWKDIMINNPSRFKGDSLPVEMVSWYDCVEFCIKKSIKEGLLPYYKIYKDSVDEFNKSEFDSIKWLVKKNPKANGYRLPTEIEWEYAAGGGQLSKNYSYSGDDTVEEIAWYWRNSGDTILIEKWDYRRLEQNHCRTHPVSSKKPNELGLYDLTGNVREWCDDWYEDDGIPRGHFRSQRGGGWIGLELHCKNDDRGYFEADGIGPDQGFRVCRNKV
ncbi:formylglycine-generating enzyme family protein [Aquimarina sp. MMG015]|uniref:formylglycine-generating enzyme family protein n=1 Tax=unclassified Aquimarina TaxID=2627091 RepID=UPI000E4FC7EE|nr:MULTISPECIES: formylglycine-generating enzyme family protein [unclassified Aquimarina]AXT57199.1 formylglycine-generating enzyme family protein [Aquimarina sp. AD1]MBQ4801570.1 formylglycine-generating enzyme family protein [Aquimarina sp. MMG015]